MSPFKWQQSLTRLFDGFNFSSHYQHMFALEYLLSALFPIASSLLVHENSFLRFCPAVLLQHVLKTHLENKGYNQVEELQVNQTIVFKRDRLFIVFNISIVVLFSVLCSHLESEKNSKINWNFSIVFIF